MKIYQTIIIGGVAIVCIVNSRDFTDPNDSINKFMTALGNISAVPRAMNNMSETINLHRTMAVTISSSITAGKI